MSLNLDKLNKIVTKNCVLYSTNLKQIFDIIMFLVMKQKYNMEKMKYNYYTKLQFLFCIIFDLLAGDGKEYNTYP